MGVGDKPTNRGGNVFVGFRLYQAERVDAGGKEDHPNTQQCYPTLLWETNASHTKRDNGFDTGNTIRPADKLLIRECGFQFVG